MRPNLDSLGSPDRKACSQRSSRGRVIRRETKEHVVAMAVLQRTWGKSREIRKSSAL